MKHVIQMLENHKEITLKVESQLIQNGEYDEKTRQEVEEIIDEVDRAIQILLPHSGVLTVSNTGAPTRVDYVPPKK